MAQTTHIVHIDLNNNQLLNATLQNLATFPSTVPLTEGYIFWHTVNNTAYCYTGLSSPNDWLDLGSIYVHPTFTGAAQPASQLTGASVISQITLTNGHVTGVATRNLTPTDIGAAGLSHTHTFSDVIGLPNNTILGNVSGGTGAAQALTQANMLAFLGIAYGSLALLNTGTDTIQRTFTPKDIKDYVAAQIGAISSVSNLSLGTRTATTMPIANSNGTGVTLPISTTSLAGLISAADKLKLDGIASGANNYVHPTFTINNAFSTAVTSGLTVLSKVTISSEGHVTEALGRTLTAADIAVVMINDAISNGVNTTWSSTKINTEIQTAVGQASTGALIYQGAFTPTTSSTAPTPTTSGTIKKAMTWVVAGVTDDFVWNSTTLSNGDMVIALVDAASSSNLAHWQIVNKNIPEILDASLTVKGIIQLASNAEGLAGTDSNKAITSSVLKAVLDARVGGYAANFGDSVATSFTITHGLNSQDVVVQVQRVSDRKEIIVDWAASTVNTVTVLVNVAPTSGQYRIIIKK